MKTKALAKRPMAARSSVVSSIRNVLVSWFMLGSDQAVPVQIILKPNLHGVMISGVLLDLAGVIYEGEKAIPGALDAVDRLRHAGFSLRFVTNTTRITKHMVLQRLARL